MSIAVLSQYIAKSFAAARLCCRRIVKYSSSAQVLVLISAIDTDGFADDAVFAADMTEVVVLSSIITSVCSSLSFSSTSNKLDGVLMVDNCDCFFGATVDWTENSFKVIPTAKAGRYRCWDW